MVTRTKHSKNDASKTFATACKALNDAKSVDELEQVWQKYQDSEFADGESADFSVKYYQRLGVLSNQWSFGEEEPTNSKQPGTTPPSDRRELWERRIKAFLEKIEQEEERIEEAKSKAKFHKKNVAALKKDLYEILSAGADDFEIDSTPLLTLAEVSIDAANEERPC